MMHAGVCARVHVRVGVGFESLQTLHPLQLPGQGWCGGCGYPLHETLHEALRSPEETPRLQRDRKAYFRAIVERA